MEALAATDSDQRKTIVLSLAAGRNVHVIAGELNISEEELVHEYPDLFPGIHIPTEKTRRDVVHMIALGINEFVIAGYVGLRMSDLKRLYWKELRQGLIEHKLKAYDLMEDGAAGTRWSEEKQEFIRVGEINPRLIIALNEKLGVIKREAPTAPVNPGNTTINIAFAQELRDAVEKVKAEREILLLPAEPVKDPDGEDRQPD